MELRPITAADTPALAAFVARIPEGDRTFLETDALDPARVATWAGDQRARRLVAVDDDGIAGIVAVVPGVGWTSHVGELRLVVDPTRRRTGLGRELARRGLLEAIDLGLTKITVEVMAPNEGAMAMFTGLGFTPEALLQGQVRDGTGALQDLVILAHEVSEQWGAMATVGLDEALS
jgi:ribosomal protein S18 acetylase RimI-like enzyme